MTAAAVPERIAALRAAMAHHGVAACLVPSADPHLSEYLPPRWQARAWLSGFTGSAGTLVVTADFAGLWTDSRYFAQAERELAGSGIELMRLRVPHQPEHEAWLGARMGAGDVVAADGATLALAAARRLRHRLAAQDAALRVDLDLPGAVWPERPALPRAPVVAHDPAFVAASADARIAAVRAEIAAAGATHHLTSALDEIAWMLNLRGSDVACNPVFLAHLLLGPETATLFTDATRLEPAAATALAASGVSVAPWADLARALAALPAAARLLLDPARVVVASAEAVPAAVPVVEAMNPATRLKAVKSAAEIEHVRATMRADGAALVTGFQRVEAALAAGARVTELDVAAWLHEARAAQPHFVGESFPTIAGWGANAALPHYQASAASHAELGSDGLLLVDSGGQYLGGTTDVTRMWAFGTLGAEARRDCTLVLKGMIALSCAQFPEGASGQQIDAIARAPLWAAGLDYGHGTGHGVGYFLNVHEGPQAIRPPRTGMQLEPLRAGMITSIEPGVYRPGRHGVRHENLAVVVPAAESECGRFLAFETLTLCPIDTRALDAALLEPQERAWLNRYHARVAAELAPLVAPAARAWLEARCAPI